MSIKIIDRLKSPNIYLLTIFSIILLAIPALTTDTVVLNTLILTFLYAYFTLSWAIIGQYAGQLSLGHALFFGLGTYISTLLFRWYRLTPWLGMLVGGGCAAVIAALMGCICFRLRGTYFILSSFAFAEIFRYLFFTTMLNPITGGLTGLLVPLVGDSLFYLQFTSRMPYYYTILALLVLLILGVRKIDVSKLGYYLRAVREDEDAAESIGISTFRCKIIAFCLSAFTTAICGTFFVQHLYYTDPNVSMGVLVSFKPIILSFLGGGGLMGPILGSFILTPIEETLTVMFAESLISGAIRGILYGIVLIVVMLFMPEGLLGPFSKLHARLFSHSKLGRERYADT